MVNDAGLEAGGKKVMVIGLDCAPTMLFNDEWLAQMPNLALLVKEGAWGPMESTVPPITCPAWMSMVTGRNPGTLGFYGFRNRRDHSYDGFKLATAADVKEPTVWDVVSRRGGGVIVLGVPQTYPVKPVNGVMVSSFLTPSKKSAYTWPADLGAELDEVTGGYVIDVEKFRTDDKERLLRDIHDMTRKRFKAARHLATTRPWDLFFMVEMGPDRLHHGFWKYCDPAHPKFEPGNPFESAMRDYYRCLDGEIGSLVEVAPADAAIMIVSDHGARAMIGGICINEWLRREGYLAAETTGEGLVRLEDAKVDWSGTKAWGAGGYYGRVFLNVAGREPQGVIPQGQYEDFRNELADAIEAIPGPDGKPIGTRVYKPQEVYPETRGVPPDLLVYFGDLAWRSVGSFGHSDVYTFENDTGPDDANHDRFGIFVLAGGAGRGRLEGVKIVDVASTILDLMGIEPLESMEGQSHKLG